MPYPVEGQGSTSEAGLLKARAFAIVTEQKEQSIKKGPAGPPPQKPYGAGGPPGGVIRL